MSSWIIAKSRPTKAKPAPMNYHDTSSDVDVYSMYMNYIAAFVYYQRLGETCNVWDSSGIIHDTLKSNPQIKLLKEKPEESSTHSDKYTEFTSTIPFKNVQKIAGSLIIYDEKLNNSVIRDVETLGIKKLFDIGIHLPKDPSGPNINLMKQYATLLQLYQTKSKKVDLNIYVMTDDYTIISQFHIYCHPSWKLTSMSKSPPKNENSAFIRSFAEVQIMTALPAMILDFTKTSDRFIYLMRRVTKLDFFVEINSREWNLI